ncbi:hypothetical protein [Mycolicibacterium sp. P1-5]|uniref:hypothetical protein n=1 Tax=Mycolicibacterium sp. P1-5 TaxID=2024617 RepID=UPI0011ED00C4|nr:hypothetical protein [Mycolicibacterium sp. P1-5]KAA0111444.1 hypothetical protein CIW47_04575 [Mycolicibacterium sp. P1-5]
MTDSVDAVLSQIDPNLPAPAIVRREVVLVGGPWLAGVSGVVGALRDQLPDYTVIEADELAAGEAPTVVVFVVSATAPLTESDCVLLDSVAAHTDAVIGVVSKIDVHRTWRQVLDTDRALLAEWATRYRDVPWVGVAAVPDLGAPVVDELAVAVRDALEDDALDQRNRLRAWETGLIAVERRLDREVAGAGREARLGALRAQRTAVLQQFRTDKSERMIALRSQIQQARLQLSYFARNRCASVRTELQEDVASLSRRTMGDFPGEVRRRATELADDVTEGVSRQLADVGEVLGLAVDPVDSRPVVDVGAPPRRSRGPETRLMVLLGAGFGLGVALTLSRVFADLAPQWAVAGAIVGVVVGVVLTLWVVNVRRLLQDRAVLDRWVVEQTGRLRTAMEEWVATCVLAAEASLGRSVAERDAADSARTEDSVARLDGEVRNHAIARSRAMADRDRQGPVIARALTAVRDELDALNRCKALKYGLLNRSCE